VFEPSDPRFVQDALTIAEFALAVVVVNIAFIYLGSKMFGNDASKNFWLQLAGFLLGGAVAGGVLAFALFEQDMNAILQGIAGGIVAALLIGLMVPKTLSRRMTATLSGPEL